MGIHACNKSNHINYIVVLCLIYKLDTGLMPVYVIEVPNILKAYLNDQNLEVEKD